MVTLLAAAVMSSPVYLATYFLGNGESGVYLAVSQDGYRFQPIVEPNVPIFRPPQGTLTRDPSIAQAPDGSWRMVWTTNWWSKEIGVATSPDLLNWNARFLPVMENYPTAINAWAPEITYIPEEDRFLIYWSSTLTDQYTETARADGDLDPQRNPLNHRFYYTSTRNFESFAPTGLLWNPGFNCIDATLMRGDEHWIMFGKDETKAPSAHKFLFVAQSETATGRYRLVSPKITDNGWVEGPTAIRVGKTYRVFFDRYADGGWGAVESDDLHHWIDVSDRVSVPRGARHGTIFPTTAETVERVRAGLRR